MYFREIKKMRLEEIDKNMASAKVEEREGYVFRDAKYEPFRTYGVFHDGERYRRIPQDVAASVNAGVEHLAKNTAGGRIRFVTDSDSVVVKILKGDPFYGGSNLTFLNNAGVALYADGIFEGIFNPGGNFSITEYETVVPIEGERKERLITLYLPLYGNIKEIEIGIKKDAVLKRASDYKYEKPIVYYGSSITQGGCASRPGMSYEAIIERALDANYVNIGLSGSAKGEPKMAEYIAGLDMGAFFYDYDANAPTPEHLALTHEPMFKKIREANPNIPIVMMTRPKTRWNSDRARRCEIIKETYDNAKKRGDENVYLIYGHELLKGLENDHTCDDSHPTDLGFWFMAKGIIPILEKILNH